MFQRSVSFAYYIDFTHRIDSSSLKDKNFRNLIILSLCVTRACPK